MATFAVTVLVGLVVGLLSGLLGIGGGMIMVPVFRLGFGLSAVASTATSLFTIIPTSVSGMLSHVRNKTCVVWLGVALGVGGACTSPIGVELAQIAPGWLVMAVVAVIIAYSSTTMLRKALEMGPEAAQGGRGKVPAADEAAPDVPGREELGLLKPLAIGALTGVASGFVGLGGGFIMVPLMVSVLKMPMRYASGTSLVAIMTLALPATVLQCALGNVEYLAGIAMACGSIPGAFAGARLASRVPERALRFLFAGVLAVTAVMLVLKEVGVLG